MSSFFIFSLFFQNIIEMKEGRSKGLSGKLQNLLQILAPIYVVLYNINYKSLYNGETINDNN